MDDKRFSLKSRWARMGFAALAVIIAACLTIPYAAWATAKVAVIGLGYTLQKTASMVVDTLIAFVWYSHGVLSANWKEK